MLLQTMSKTLFIFVCYLTCCIWARSLSQYRNQNINTYNSPYLTDNLDSPISDFLSQPQISLNSNNNYQWDRAIDPVGLGSYYDLLDTDDYYNTNNQQGSFSDVEALSNMINTYDSNPVWGQIVKQQPESELEALKAEERRREAEQRELLQEEALEDEYKQSIDYPSHFGSKRASAPAFARQTPQQHNQHPVASAVTSAPSVSTSHSSSAPVATTTASSVSKSKAKVQVQPGQKEVPLLRPPNRPKEQQEHEAEAGSDDEPVIQVVQRSSAVEKPSAYDTLRKYLTLEDALKKEAEKRRVHKRASPSSFSGKKQIISDVESLGGQLKNLKKSSM